MKSLKVFSTAGAVLALALVLGPRVGLGAGTKAAEKPPLVIPGQGFSFSVRQPDGWQADEQAMKKYQASLAFAPKSEDGREPDVTIVVRAIRKLNENVALSLETDKQAYRQKEPAVQFAPLDVKHPLYATFPQLFSKPGEFYVYTTYLNPKGFMTYFSVVMPKKKSAATPRELAAYKEVLESLRILPAETDADSE
ncbi:MAG TPA: hypothetical protein VHC97_04390 [Thermoanaerobaculia bacterium]|nr:hypothetical protein [Thermoanaerobaculia bacterium]